MKVGDLAAGRDYSNVTNHSMTKSAISFQDTTASALLDLVRAAAALLVCLSHWRSLLFVDYARVASHRGLLAPFYVFTGAGHQSVVIFFVLSGYLVGGSVLRLYQQQRWSWKLYFTHRLVRLWIVLAPALLAGLVLDRIGIATHAAPLLYTGQAGNSVLSFDVASSLTPAAFAGNLVFLQTIVVHTFGSNGPLWSLANEFWYYMLFPLALLSIRAKGWPHRTTYAVIFLLCALLVGRSILLLFPVWLMGVMLARLPRLQLSRPVLTIGVALYAATFFFLAKTHLVTGVASDTLLGGATFLLLWALLGVQSAAGSPAWVRASRFTAGFSYSLYLVHLPLIVLITALSVHDTRWQPTPAHLASALAIFAVALLYAVGFAALTEFRTASVRGAVEARLGILPRRKAILSAG